MSRLTLLRHTKPDVPPGTCYGRSDLRLAESFADEYESVLSRLPAFDHLISSPLQRCQRLARHIATATDTPLLIRPDWTEMDFGAWENRLWSDLPRADLDEWAADFLSYRGHGGESVAQLRARIERALAALPAGRCLIVTHMGAIKATLDIHGSEDAWNAQLPFGGCIRL